MIDLHRGVVSSPRLVHDGEIWNAPWLNQYPQNLFCIKRMINYLHFWFSAIGIDAMVPLAQDGHFVREVESSFVVVTVAVLPNI